MSFNCYQMITNYCKLHFIFSHNKIDERSTLILEMAERKGFPFSVSVHRLVPGFERVKEAFCSNFSSGVELGAQLCIYYKGEVVVDLCGRILEPPYRNTDKPVLNDQKREIMSTLEEYSSSSLQTVFSSTKNLTALCIAVLVDRGLLDYSERISTYWPKFGQNGKDQITLADVLRHDSGLFRFYRQGQVDDVKSLQKMCCLVEKSAIRYFKSKYTPRPYIHDKILPSDGKRRGYHGVSRGIILSCLISKVDPQQRTVASFFRDEIVRIVPGLKDHVFIGMTMTQQKQHHICDMAPYQYRWSQRDPDGKIYKKYMNKFAKESGIGGSILMMNAVTPGKLNSTEFRALEIGSMSGIANARGLAKLAAIMAGRGSVNGVQIISEEVFALSHSAIVQKYDDVLLEETRFSQGGFGQFRMDHTSREYSEGRGSILGGCNTFGVTGDFYGWGGSGGSVFVWSPDHALGFAYTMNGMASYVLGGPRTNRIFSALFESISILMMQENQSSNFGPNKSTTTSKL